MLTPSQTEVVNHLILIFPNHTRDTIEKTVQHLIHLKDALDQGQLLQRSIDLLLDRNLAEQFGSAIPQEFEQPGEILFTRMPDDVPVNLTVKENEEVYSKSSLGNDTTRKVDVDKGMDTSDVILTKIETGEAVVTGLEGPDVYFVDDTSKKSSSSFTDPASTSCSANAQISSGSSGCTVKLAPSSSSADTPGLKNNDVRNNANKKVTENSDEIDGDNVTDALNKLALPVSGSSAASSSAHIVLSSGSTTPTILLRTPSPWTDDDLPPVLSPEKPQEVSSVSMNKSAGVEESSDDDDGLPEILWPIHKSAFSGNANNNSKTMPDKNNSALAVPVEVDTNNEVPKAHPAGFDSVKSPSTGSFSSTLEKNFPSFSEKMPVEQGVIEINKLIIKKTGSSYELFNKAAVKGPVAGTTTSEVSETKNFTHSASKTNEKNVSATGTYSDVMSNDSFVPKNPLHSVFKIDNLAIDNKHSKELEEDHSAAILGNNSPKIKKSLTPYKTDLTRKTLAQRESNKSPKVTKPDVGVKTEHSVKSENFNIRAGIFESVKTPNAAQGHTNSNKKKATPYKTDLTWKTLAERELPHIKVTLYDTVTTNTPVKHVSDTFKPGNDMLTPSERKFKSHKSAPNSGTGATWYDTNSVNSQETVHQSRANHHSNIPHKSAQKPARSATVTTSTASTHTRVTMYETPTKATPNVDVMRRHNSDPLPTTQPQDNKQRIQDTNQTAMATREPIIPNQIPVVSKATVTIQSQHVITYSDNVAKPTVVSREQTVVLPQEPMVVLSAPEVTVHSRIDHSIGLAAPGEAVERHNQREAEIPDVILTMEKSAEEERQQVVKEVLNLFPDVELNFLQNLAMQHTGPYAVNNICDVLLENQYPIAMATAKPTATTTTAAAKPDTEDSSVDYYTDYESVTLPYKDEITYGNQVIAQLSQDFRWFPNAILRKVFNMYSNRYAPSYRALREIWVEFVKSNPEGQKVRYSGKEVKGKIEKGEETKEIKFFLLKNPRPNASPAPNRHSLLLKEIAFISKRDHEMLTEADYKMAEELNAQMYEEFGEMIECGCCYGEYPFEGMIQCYEGHLFCQSCLNMYARESVFGQGKANLTCMTDECKSTFPKSQLIRALPSNVLDKYEDRMQEESLNLADLGDLVRCPHCDFAAIMDPGDKVFKCQMTTCMKETCRYCKEDWGEHFGKKCEEVEKKDETKLRLEYEEKMTKAKVRTCHRCKAEFCKEDGCNKMTCRCGAKMCYICRKPNIDYNHFCQHPRDPGQNCKTCTACSLWTHADEDDNRAVAEIQKAAEEARKEKGYTEERLIGAPSEPPAKKQKTK